MRIEEIVTLEEYDKLTTKRLQKKIPNLESTDIRMRFGDSIYYNFKNGRPKQRKGVHGASERDTDLRGKNALLSKSFFYFGQNAIPLPAKLKGLVINHPNHLKLEDAALVKAFEDWLLSLKISGKKIEYGGLYGEPDLWQSAHFLKANCTGCTPVQIKKRSGC